MLSEAFSIKIGEAVNDGVKDVYDVNWFIAINSLFAVAMTAAIVIMVVQGNKRNYILKKYN